MARHRLNRNNANLSERSSSASSMAKFRTTSESRSTSRSRSRSRSGSFTPCPRSRSSTTSSFLNFISNNGGYHTQNLTAESNHQNRFFSLYRLLMLELNLPDDTSQRPYSGYQLNEEADNSYEQILNMVKIPYLLERCVLFGLLVCLNSFLTLFTLVPLKILILSYKGTIDLVKYYKRTSSLSITIFSQRFRCAKRDIITITIIILSITILSSPQLDISRMYHDVRGQAHIKLYVMFGVLEVADKLCSSIGQDILSILYSIPITSCQYEGRNWIKFIIFFLWALIYLSFHSYILIYQTVSLNVAANSYSNALLTLLLSNQFAELKSSVFKKFEREGLFQITMADLTERFQLSLMLSIIALRNLLQLNSTHMGLIPNSWKSWNTWFGAIFGPGVVVIGSEILVDWLKHCYISKFNKIRPRIYHNFLYVLSLDFLQVFRSTPNNGTNLSHELTDYIVLTKRIGLPLLALIVCFLRMTLPDLQVLFIFPVTFSFIHSILVTQVLILISFLTLVFIRLILGLIILKWANHIKNEHQAFQINLKEKASKVKPKLHPMKTGDVLASTTSGAVKTIIRTTSSETDVSTLTSPNFYFNKTLSAPTLPLSNRSSPSPGREYEETERILDGDYVSIKSPIELSFLPGIPNTEASSINPSTRSYLYDYGEKIPPTVEEKRNKQLLNGQSTQGSLKNRIDEDEGLGKVMRYEMSSKRIW